MSSRLTELTNYYSVVQERSNLVSQDFNDKTPHREVSLAELRGTHLSPEATAELYALNKEGTPKQARQGRQTKEPGSIDLIISLVTLQTPRTKTGLLLLQASLDSDGKLSVDVQSQRPWIPVNRMRSKGTQDREVMVGDLASFWAWQQGPGVAQISGAETWADAVDAAFDLFDSVADENLDATAAEVDCKVLRDSYFITPGQKIVANAQILKLYDFLEDDGAVNAPVYQKLLNSHTDARINSDTIDLNPKFLWQSARLTTGSMNDEFPLTETQRRAVHAFQADRLEDEPITAVSGPPGTGKTTMLQSVVASLIVDHALEGKAPPLIVGTSTNNQAVTNIIDSFSKIMKDEPGPLDQRWLPKHTPGGVSNQPMSRIATYCPSASKSAEAKKAGYLTENVDKGGVYSDHTDPEYLEPATQYFLARMGEFMSAVSPSSPSNLEGAIKGLRGILTTVNAARLKLIDKRYQADQSMGGSSGAPSTVDETVLEELEARTTEYQQRFDAWCDQLDQLYAAGSAHDFTAHDFAMDMTQTEDEPAGYRDSVYGYIEYYHDELKALDRQKHELQEANMVAREQEHLSRLRFQKTAAQELATLQSLGLLSEDHMDRLRSAANLYALDQALDTTVRYVQFWLALHIYEAQWLLAGENKEFIDADERWKKTLPIQGQYWAQAACLTPCFVMTAYQLPKYFSLWVPDNEKPQFDLGRADLMIVDEAGQVDTSVGAAAFAVPKRALVVGDVKQVAPVWGIDGVSDEELAGGHELEDHWEFMKEAGLTASEGSSIMKAASAASRWKFGADEDPGLFLAEHFRCHTDIIEYCNDLLYKGQLKPSRPLGGYKLKELVESPFQFRQVPNSKDQRRGSSRVNQQEASQIAQWIGRNFDPLRQIYNPDANSKKDEEIIGVVTPFAAQARLITNQLYRVLGKELAQQVTVGTAHRLQGAERSVVLFSSVYGDNSGQASFVDSTLELMNVAVSRAKDLFIVFGGQKRWNDSGPVFSLVRQHATLTDREFATSGATAKVRPAEAPAEPTSEPSEATAAVLPPPPPPPAPATETQPAAQIRMVSRDEPGYLIASDLIKAWTEDGILPAGQKVSATQLNTTFEREGLIEKIDGSWVPTARGTELGIALYEGTGKSGPYTNLIYSPEARQRLSEAIRQGQIRFD